MTTSATNASTPTLPTSDDDQVNVDGFFSNKGAMIAVFTCAGIVLLLLGAILNMAWQRKRRRRRQKDLEITERRVSVPSSVPASAFGHLEPNVARPSPSLLFSLRSGRDGRGWWVGGGRRSRNTRSISLGSWKAASIDSRRKLGSIDSGDSILTSSSQLADQATEKSGGSIIGWGDVMVYRPSGEESEVGHIYGRVRGIEIPTPTFDNTNTSKNDSNHNRNPLSPPPPTRRYPPAARLSTWSHGGSSFTLEDALLPGLNSPGYTPRSPGRHPYAQ